jgi:hypothetical protein
MARYCIVVFTDSVKGAEMDFTRWYDERRSAEDRPKIGANRPRPLQSNRRGPFSV